MDHVGVVRLQDWTSLSVRGADRASFLHNLCTNDVRGLAVGDQCEAFFTDVKGKLIGHVVVFAQDDALALVTVPGQAERLIAHLDRYIIREDVQLVDVSASTEWSLVLGPRSAEVVGSCSEGRVVFPCRQLGGMAFWTTNWDTKPEGLGHDTRAKPQAVGDAVWHAVRLESGWPLFGVDFDGSNLPQEVGRDDRAISFRKGCYLGQETVARIDALGHVNQRLATVKLAAETAPGDELTVGDKVVGRITSVGYSPRLQAWLGLAMVRRGHNDAGSQLVCRNQAAEVVPTPAVVA
jgi:folate-binding protein YgfZ